MQNPVILVTGASGQLGQELRALQQEWPASRFLFLSKDDLPIHQYEEVRHFFKTNQPSHCINCAAYTAVDKAESDRERAMLVNGEAVGVLAAVCAQHDTRFVHISTDYVFDGLSPEPYTEADAPNPVNAYGQSKLKGEQLCMANNPSAVIIRTAWVYSEFGHNFVKTMLRLLREKSSINVVSDQIGAPTYAADLAAAILKIVNGGIWIPGIYHYSNAGRISWFDFAIAIRELIGSSCTVNPITTAEYPTAAKRPSFSLLNAEKIRTTYRLQIPEWKPGLERCLKHLQVVG